MKTINTTKIMADKEKEKIKARKDKSEERQKQELIHKFIDVYVKPKTLCLGITNVNVLGELDHKCEQIIFYLMELNEKENHLLEKEEIGFLYSKDPKIKSRIGKKIADYLIRSFTYNEKLNKYKEEYISALLEKLNQESIINYDVKALDNKTKISTERINKIVNKFINDSAINSIQFPLFVNLYNEDYKTRFDFLFSESIQVKKEFADLLYNYIKENINNIDLKNIDNIDFGAYTGAKLD